MDTDIDDQISFQFSVGTKMRIPLQKRRQKEHTYSYMKTNLHYVPHVWLTYIETLSGIVIAYLFIYSYFW